MQLPGPNEHPATIVVENLQDDDVYGVSLDVGSYQLALVDQKGCATCLPRWSERDGGFECGTITVAPGAVTQHDILIDASGK